MTPKAYLSLTHRLLEAKNRAHGLPSHYSEICEAPGKGDFRLDSVIVPGGFYRIAQTTDQGQVNDATLTHPAPGVQQTDLAVKMNSSSQFAGNQIWKLTPQYGVEKGYTIVPLDTPIPELKGEGGTTYDVEKSVKVKRSGLYPIWQVVCVLLQKFDDEVTHEEVSVYSFRIIEVGTTHCWNTKDGNVDLAQIASITDSRGHSMPSPVQRFELIQVNRADERIEMKSVDTVSVTANNANVERKFYFGTNPIPAGDLKSYLSTQLETDARDQGWASDPNQGLWSWFELAILTSAPKPGDLVDKQIKVVDGKLCTWVSHILPLSGNFQEQTGRLFDHSHEMWKYLGAGNIVGVLACAQFPGWKSEARRGNLYFERIAWVPTPDPKVAL